MTTPRNAAPRACESFTGSSSARYMLTFKREGANLVAFAYIHLSAVTLANDKVVMIDFGAYAVQLDGEGLTYIAEKVIKHEASVIHEGGTNPDASPGVTVRKITLVDKSKDADGED